MTFHPVAIILASILAIAGYLAIFQSVCSEVRNRRLVPILGVAALFIYLCILGFVGVLFVFFGYDPIVLFAALVLAGIAALAWIVRCCVKHRQYMNWFAVVFFAAYCLLVGYVTLYIRVGTVVKNINMVPFARITRALETGNTSLMEHDMLNLLMFVPLGILVPLMNRRVFHKLSYAFLFGITATVAIETTQMVAHLGIFDIDDIIANVLGMLAGYGLCSLCLLAMNRFWRINR